MPEISVIVPVYNTASRLPRCVESILAQTFPDFELILVDDGSTDDSPALCDHYAAADPRVRVIHQENQGVSLARNAGLDAATGTYICFADSDDSAEPNLLETARIQMLLGADMTVFRCQTEENGQMIRLSDHLFGTFTLAEPRDRLRFLLHTLLPCRIGWEVWNRMFVRERIERYRLRFPAHQDFGEDLYFCLCYCAHGSRVVSLPDCLYRYHRHSASIMARNSGRLNLNAMNELSKAAERFLRGCGDCPELLAGFPAVHAMLIYNELCRCRALLNGKGSAYRKLILDNVDDTDYFLAMLRQFLPHAHWIAGSMSPGQLLELKSAFRYLLDGSYTRFRLRNRLICLVFMGRHGKRS